MPIHAPRPGTARVRSDAARRIPRLRPPDRRSACPHFLWSSLWTSCAFDPQAIDPAVKTSPDQSSGTRQRRPRNRPTNADGRAPWRSILAVLPHGRERAPPLLGLFPPRRNRRLFHNFCWQACGQAEHWAFNPLIRRPFPERVKQAATHANRAVGRRTIFRCHALSPACRATSTSAHPVSRIRHPASIHRASRPHGLFHNFCWQACGHPEHPPSNTLIRRRFPETVRNAASRLKSVRRAPHGRRPPPNRPAASPRRQSSTTHFRRGSFPQFLCANLWISRAAARQAIDPSELFAILVPAARRLAQASAMRSGARAARASAYTGACRHRRTCPCRRRAAHRRQSG
ncbi:hypothetical protein Y598_3351 [Burkholderia pseudomallei MSHR3335]|nr:hypothetical protein Y598_3351 [Burkholderia pseudomallei MSHR3335]